MKTDSAQNWGESEPGLTEDDVASIFDTSQSD